MKNLMSFVCGLGLMCIPLISVAQDAALEDSLSGVEDGASGVEDAAVAGDAGLVDRSTEDSAVMDDAAVMGDATVANDVVTVADAALADAATTHDAAIDDAGGPVPCGDVTYLGACDGTWLQYCNPEVGLVGYDCAMDEGEPTSLICGLVDCTDEENCYGFDCVSPAGGMCVYQDAENWLGCDVAANMGCIDGLCAASSTCNPANHTPSCTGDSISACFQINADATGGSVWHYDCSVGGTEPYACGQTPNGGNDCLGLAGGRCNPSQGGYCATGLTCAASGTCVTSTSDDAGNTGTDAGNTSPDAASSSTDAGSKDKSDAGCTCAAKQAGTSAALVIIGLSGMALIRRRRQ